VRHHSDTIIVGRDPEIVFPAAGYRGAVLGFFSLRTIPLYFRHVLLHAAGRLTPERRLRAEIRVWEGLSSRPDLPADLCHRARLAIYQRSLLPLMFVGLPSFTGRG